MEQEDYENSLDAIYDEIQDTQFDIPHIIETSDAVAVAAEYGTPNADDSCWILAERLKKWRAAQILVTSQNHCAYFSERLIEPRAQTERFPKLFLSLF